MSLLHLSLNDRILVDDYYTRRICRYFVRLFSLISKFYDRYPCLQTSRVLLQYGAAVDAVDTTRNTPLHVIVSNKEPCDESFLDLLCDAGAHLDYANTLAKTPADLATTANIRQLLKSRMNMSLKCLCARLIRKSNVFYGDRIGTSLITFVEKH